MQMITNKNKRLQSGVTLVELIMVIVIMGIAGVTMSIWLNGPIRAYFDQQRRAGLVDAADYLLRQMSDDIRSALPNSIRTNSGSVIELLPVIEGARYRDSAPAADLDRVLEFTISDGSFSVLGKLMSSTSMVTALAIYPLGQPGGNPYTGDAVMTAAGSTFSFSEENGPSGDSETLIEIIPAHRFSINAPSKMVFLTSGPVSYLCEDGRLLRVDRYPMQAIQPTSLAELGALGGRMVELSTNVSQCQLTYLNNTNSGPRQALVTVSIVLEEDGEKVALLRQTHVDNAP